MKSFSTDERTDYRWSENPLELLGLVSFKKNTLYLNFQCILFKFIRWKRILRTMTNDKQLVFNNNFICI